MIDVPTPSQTRDELERAVIADLLGPADGPKEIVDERNIRDRYLVGRLAPRGHSALPEQSDDATLGGPDGEDGLTEAPPPKAATLFPSSIGLTFAVSGDAPALQITARWGRYERVRIEDDAYRNKDGTLRSVWRRVPVEAVSAPISLRPGRLPDWSPDPDRPDVFVQGLARLREEQSSELVEEWVVTLFLVNGQQKPARNTDEAWLFQPELVVAAPDGSAVFQKRPALLDDAELETQTMAMLYRRRVEFAVGHGIAVQAELAPGQVDRATRLRTVVVPAYEVPQTTPPTVEEIPALAGLTLDMKALSQVADGDFSAQLSPLVGAYAAWIEAQAARIAAEPDLAPYRDAARHAIAHCRRTLERIRAGVALLDADPQAAHAFRFANRAMHQQRVRSLYAAGVRRAQSPNLAEIDIPPNHSWRTFQLAFILLNLPSLTDLTHPDRSPISNTQHLHRAADAVQVSPIPNPQYPISPTADLLWFPTGGGKTEAYLGLAAYVMGLRRLQGEIAGRSGHAGVAVLMRYTLRLLTLQQFQRATALLCACEVIRREDPGLWGSEPFRIGLWVGRRSTPNWTQEADEAVKQLRRDAYVGGGRGTPHQLTNCPWCGAKIEPGRDIEVETPERGRGRTFIYCGDRLGRCPFGRRQSPAEGIPALVVDEEIYRRLPSLLIATVDKFAQMPWNGRTAMLFGQVDGYCERHGYRSPEIEDSDRHPKKGKHPPARTLPAAPLRPPDLIIQDELHLINGPLGTLVGLYETAVDRLASWEVDRQRVRPKVIASTATIRRAEGQVHNLFLRRVNVFPPHGLDAEDNFFSRQREPSAEHPGRRYLGLCAQGVRHKTALIRAYVAFLAAAQKLYEQPGTDADPWMTLVGYFNSLRELGSLRRAVDDTVTTRLRWMKQRNLARRYLNPWRVVELTSRRSAADIPEILDRLETVFKPSREGQKPRRDVSKLPVDVLLATNMISVGVDVGRLGLMVVASQPKTTAEYIQATSRVGRRHPGLVCTVYNWARPRDLSHYERFAHYHATFYQHVEALSVTPFSPRALDRGLGAVFVSLVRLLGLELNANDGAAAFSKEHPHALEALEQLVERAAHVAGVGRADLVRRGIDARLDEWGARASRTASGARLGYRDPRDGITVGLLKPPGLGGLENFTCLNSLRDVEPTVNLIVDDYGMDRGAEQGWTFAGADETEGEE